jgi:F-type H+-transporting ATPase subunit delta
MKISKEARSIARQLFKRSFTRGKLSEATVRKVLRELTERKPRHCIEILEAYKRLVALEMDKRRAVVESAHELDAETWESIVHSLKAKYGNDVQPVAKVTPELIGGLRIRIASDVWDNSVRDRLARLEQDLIHA